MNPLQFRPQQVNSAAFIAPTAVVVGDVTIGPEASVWYQAVVRGDSERIEIGPGTNIQDGAILHADPGYPCKLAQRVTVGHGAIVHGATVAAESMIGMRAVIMNGAVIGEGSLVAVGAVVTEGMQIPPGSIVMGMPGKIVAPVSEKHRARIAHAADHYIELTRNQLQAETG